MPKPIKSPLTVAYYVSGHGFGHAIRSGEVMAQLLDLHPEVRIEVRSTAPSWLFDRLGADRCRVTSVQTDVGVVQQDGLRFRTDETRRALEELQGRVARVARSERAFWRKERVRLVVSDIAPLPLQWAAQSGLPSIAVGNFGWDEIYGGFARRDPAFGEWADRYREGYGAADCLLRLPFYMPMEAFRRVENAPLVVRAPARGRSAVRRDLQAGTRPVVFLSFGGFQVEGLPWDSIAASRDYLFVVATSQERSWPANLRVLDPVGLDHPGLVAAADVVVGKPGYGTVAEVTASQTRMLYTSRGRFPEYPYLTRALRATGQVVYWPRREMARGNLEPYLQKVLARPERSARPRRSDGARVVASRLLQLAGVE